MFTKTHLILVFADLKSFLVSGFSVIQIGWPHIDPDIRSVTVLQIFKIRFKTYNVIHDD